MLAAFVKILYYLPLALIIGASGIGLARFRRLAPALRYLTLLACFDVAMEVSGFTLYALRIPNVFLLPISIVGETAILLLVYKQALQSTAFSRSIPWAIALLMAYAGLRSMPGVGVFDYQPGIQVIGYLVALGLASLYFRKLLHEPPVTRLANAALFWISGGLLVYALGNLLIALFSNYLFVNFSQELNMVIWRIHNGLASLLYASYCLALGRRPAKQPLGTPVPS